MIVVMFRVSAAAGAVALATCVACSNAPVETLELERGMLTVNNTSSDQWTDVEIWINRSFRITVPSIAAGARFQVPASSFVDGYGRRFDFDRMQLIDLRLTAKTSSAHVEHVLPLRRGGLEAIGGHD